MGHDNKEFNILNKHTLMKKIIATEFKLYMYKEFDFKNLQQ